MAQKQGSSQDGQRSSQQNQGPGSQQHSDQPQQERGMGSRQEQGGQDQRNGIGTQQERGQASRGDNGQQLGLDDDEALDDEALDDDEAWNQRKRGGNGGSPGSERNG